MSFSIREAAGRNLPREPSLQETLQLFLQLAPVVPRDLTFALLLAVLLLLIVALRRKSLSLLGAAGIVVGLTGTVGAETFFVAMGAAVLAALVVADVGRIKAAVTLVLARIRKAAESGGCPRRRRHWLTRRDHNAQPAPDLVKRKCEALEPNRLWTADITDVPTSSGPSAPCGSGRGI